MLHYEIRQNLNDEIVALDDKISNLTAIQQVYQTLPPGSSVEIEGRFKDTIEEINDIERTKNDIRLEQRMLYQQMIEDGKQEELRKQEIEDEFRQQELREGITEEEVRESAEFLIKDIQDE